MLLQAATRLRLLLGEGILGVAVTGELEPDIRQKARQPAGQDVGPDVIGRQLERGRRSKEAAQDEALPAAPTQLTRDGPPALRERGGPGARLATLAAACWSPVRLDAVRTTTSRDREWGT